VILRGWTLCFDANSMPLLQLLLAATGVVTLIVICHRRVFEEIVQAWTWLHSTPAMGADGITALAKERWYRRTVRRYGETYEPNPSRQCEPMSITMCVGLARKVSQNQTEPFSLRRTCAGSAVITRGVSRAGPRYGSKDSEARAVRTACGGIVESARERQLLGPHSQRARKSQGLRGTSVG
jgi:hypothetical protein